MKFFNENLLYITNYKKGLASTSIIITVFLLSLISLNHSFIKAFNINYSLITSIEKNEILNYNGKILKDILINKYHDKDTFINTIKDKETLALNETDYLEFLSLFSFNGDTYALFMLSRRVNKIIVKDGFIFNLSQGFNFSPCDLE